MVKKNCKKPIINNINETKATTFDYSIYGGDANIDFAKSIEIPIKLTLYDKILTNII